MATITRASLEAGRRDHTTSYAFVALVIFTIVLLYWGNGSSSAMENNEVIALGDQNIKPAVEKPVRVDGANDANDVKPPVDEVRREPGDGKDANEPKAVVKKPARPRQDWDKAFYHHARAKAGGKSGAAIYDMLLCHHYAYENGATYGGACGEADYTEHAELLKSIGLDKELPFSCPRDVGNDASIKTSMIQRSDYTATDTLFWTQEYISYLKSKVNYPPKPDKYTIAVHIRRGKELSPCKPKYKDYDRYLPNSHYQRLIDKHMKEGARVIIFSQSPTYESLDEFSKKGYDVHLDRELPEIWQTLVVSDVVILSKSGFGLIPAMVTQGKAVYTPFWQTHLNGWEVVDKENLDLLEADMAKLKGACKHKRE